MFLIILLLTHILWLWILSRRYKRTERKLSSKRPKNPFYELKLRLENIWILLPALNSKETCLNAYSPSWISITLKEYSNMMFFLFVCDFLVSVRTSVPGRQVYDINTLHTNIQLYINKEYIWKAKSPMIRSQFDKGRCLILWFCGNKLCIVS